MVAGLLVGTALLTGCSDATEANDTLPSTSSAPTTEALPEVGPADFPVPDEARTKDAEGAEAFLRYFIELLNRQRAVPDGEPIRNLGADCQECLRIAQNYDEAAAAGNRYVGGDITIRTLAEPVEDEGALQLNFIAAAAPVQLVDAAGEEVEPGPAGSDNLSSGIELRWSEDQLSWIVTGFQLG
jgi:hypothetical protein